MTQFTLRTLDLPSLHRSAIGFDRMFEELNRTFANSKSGNYPPHNIVQVDETHFVVEVAVAGFAESEINVELADNVLTVTGEKVKDLTTPSDPKYLHHGISNRDFTRDFTLAENVEVRGATVKNGILSVELELVIPEEKQPKKIAIVFNK
jgi:molecular chaperone IbpA